MSEDSVLSYLAKTQDELFKRLKPSNDSDIPSPSSQNPNVHWIPQLFKLSFQSDRSFNEQAILDELLKVIIASSTVRVPSNINSF